MTLARITDPETSHLAARQLSGRAGTIRRRLLECYDAHYPANAGLTADEVAYRAGFTAEDGYWKRVSDLFYAGLLEDTGERRKAHSGRLQRVLRISETGRGVLGGAA